MKNVLHKAYLKILSHLNFRRKEILIKCRLNGPKNLKVEFYDHLPLTLFSLVHWLNYLQSERPKIKRKLIHRFLLYSHFFSLPDYHSVPETWAKTFLISFMLSRMPWHLKPQLKTILTKISSKSNRMYKWSMIERAELPPTKSTLFTTSKFGNYSKNLAVWEDKQYGGLNYEVHMSPFYYSFENRGISTTPQRKNYQLSKIIFTLHHSSLFYI